MTNDPKNETEVDDLVSGMQSARRYLENLRRAVRVLDTAHRSAAHNDLSEIVSKPLHRYVDGLDQVIDDYESGLLVLLDASRTSESKSGGN